MKVLFLSAWYPTRNDAMAGLFVKNHAEAVSKYAQISVLHIEAQKNLRKVEYIIQKGKIGEVMVYYPDLGKGVIKSIYRLFMFFLLYHLGYYKVLKNFGKPDLVHVNILTRLGLIAMLMKTLRGIPFVVSEHWSRYLPVRKGYHGFFRKKLTNWIISNAECVMPVSEILMKAMQNCGLKHINYRITANVVNPLFFKPTPKLNPTSEKKQILHISCFDDDAKNVTGILDAIRILSLKRTDFVLKLVGTGIDKEKIQNHFQNLKLPKEMVIFTGEQSPDEVRNLFDETAFMILFSRYETAGVVIAESLVCGKPVISTSVGIAPEVLNENTGILLKSNQPEELAEAMDIMLDKFAEYDEALIRMAGSNFSYDQIGRELNEIYQEALNGK